MLRIPLLESLHREPHKPQPSSTRCPGVTFNRKHDRQTSVSTGTCIATQARSPGQLVNALPRGTLNMGRPYGKEPVSAELKSKAHEAQRVRDRSGPGPQTPGCGSWEGGNPAPGWGPADRNGLWGKARKDSRGDTDSLAPLRATRGERAFPVRPWPLRGELRPGTFPDQTRSQTLTFARTSPVTAQRPVELGHFLSLIQGTR